MHRILILASSLLLAVGCASDAAVQKTPGVIDPRVDELMHSVCDRAAAQRDFRFTIVDTIDEVQPEGHKLQFSHHREVSFTRPSLLHVEAEGDKAHRSLWKDGTTITLADHDHEVYATLDDPGTLDDMMDMLWNEYGIATPLADILSSDPYATFMEGALAAQYVGIGTVDEVPCHHLAIQHEQLDFQIWLTEEDERLKKLVITYWSQPGEPQYTLVVGRVDTPSRLSRVEFEARLPDHFEQIELSPLLSETGR